MPPSAEFPTTRWVLLNASGTSFAARKRAALDELVKIYWEPVYVYIRRKGHSSETAADLTQSFFLKLCDREAFSNAREEKGRFRNYLLTALNHFLHDAWRHENAGRRKASELVSLDLASLEEKLKLNSAAPPPDVEFDQNWTRKLITKALEELKEVYLRDGKHLLWHYASPLILKDPSGISYEDAAAVLGMSNEALRKEVSRARKLLRQKIVDHIAKTVSSPAQIEEELRDLFLAWA